MYEPQVIDTMSSKAMYELLKPFSKHVSYPRDKKYKLISPRTFKDLMDLSKVQEWVFVEDDRDCDDFCYMFKGFLGEKRLGTIAIFPTIVRRKKDEGLHMLLGTPYKKDGVWTYVFGEPQDAKIVDDFGWEILRITP